MAQSSPEWPCCRLHQLFGLLLLGNGPSIHTRKMLKIFPVQVPEHLIPSHFKWYRQLGKLFSHQADGLERHFTETIQNIPTCEHFPFVSAFFLLQKGTHINTLKPLGSPLFCNNYRTISSNSILPIATNVSLHQLQTEAVQFASGSQGFNVIKFICINYAKSGNFWLFLHSNAWITLFNIFWNYTEIVKSSW